MNQKKFSEATSQYILVMKELRNFAAKNDLSIDKSSNLSNLLDQINDAKTEIVDALSKN